MQPIPHMRRLCSAVLVLAPSLAAAQRIEVSFARSAHEAPITGRVYVAISRDGSNTPISQTGETGVPLFGVNIENLAAGSDAVIDDRVLGYPVKRLSDLPKGEYYFQPFVNVYTRFARAD